MMTNKVGLCPSIKAYMEGEPQLAKDTKPMQGSFQCKRVLAVVGAGVVGAACSAVICVPAGIFFSAVRVIDSIYESKQLYSDNWISLPKLIINILIELTLGFAIGAIALTFTTFIDFSLILITTINKINVSNKAGDETLTKKLGSCSYPRKKYAMLQQQKMV
jgi:hypothetical protein